MSGRYYYGDVPYAPQMESAGGWHIPRSAIPERSRQIDPRLVPYSEGYPIQQQSNRRQRSSSRKRRGLKGDQTPRTIDVVGNGADTTVSGHIDLLQHLPLRNRMHRKLLETFQKSPDNYEGHYSDPTDSRATIKDLGNGYLTIHFHNDINQLELGEFLVGQGWTTLAVSHDGEKTFEKWTNVIQRKKKSQKAKQPPAQAPPVYYHF